MTDLCGMAGLTHTGQAGRSSRAAFICCVIAALASTACMPQAGALSEMDIEPIQVGPPGSGGMAPVQFMVGCWRGPAAGGTAVYEERFTPSAAGIMLGSSRMFSGPNPLVSSRSRLGLSRGPGAYQFSTSPSDALQLA